MAEVLALGDCNTLGVGELKENAYAELFAKAIDKSMKNCGFTMSTTREMKYFFQDFIEDNTEIILIQYGLVDSWKTFKYAPYVLYYPDNKMRKIIRKIVKKYKKITKSLGLNTLLGVKNVVPLKEYEENIESLIKQVQNRLVLLVETVPNLDTSRNSEILKYNQVMKQLANKYGHVYCIEVYSDLVDKSDKYEDQTHLNESGYRTIANKIESVYKQIQSDKK
jgi:lysophospholipase L1-like esterase